MRIVIDLQAAQTGARDRGIGRYCMSLTKAVIQSKGRHEVLIVLNGLFPGTVEQIRADFEGLLSGENICVWHAPGPVYHLENTLRRKTAELVREAFIAGLRPDVVHVPSLFEGWGWGDNAVTSIGLLGRSAPTAVTLHDLIPLIDRTNYLNDPQVESWYESKLDQIRRADLLLAVSESSRQEAIRHLGFPQDRVINASEGVGAQFKPIKFGRAARHRIMERYGLGRPFVMYTGAIDRRKNLDGLIRAWALVPESLRLNHQLAIVCALHDHGPVVEEQIKQLRFAEDEVVLTGFVPDEDLIALYNLCEVFVFPSFHEGFGLPGLEAMSCGAPVVASNLTSIPEVIGREDALFDPHDDKAIAEKISHVLTDDAYRNALIRHGLEQSKKFSWDESARRAIAAFEQLHASRKKSPRVFLSPRRRPKLAYVSPLPPVPCDAADFSARLLPELARHYEIDVIVNQQSISDPWIRENCSPRDADWFLLNARSYDRILYHIGSSEHFSHAFDLLTLAPGVAVLNDFFLAELLLRRDLNGSGQNGLQRELYHSHGYKAVQDFHACDPADAVAKYPCNKTVFENARGIIARSDDFQLLAQKWFGEIFPDDWCVIPGRQSPRASADAYAEAIENFFRQAETGKNALIGAVARIEPAAAGEQDWPALAGCIAQNHPPPSGKQLLIDISELVERDAGTGIQRVVRNILAELLGNPPPGYRVEPVYATEKKLGYRYARRFTLGFLGCPDHVLDDDPVEAFNGDIFFGLDLRPRLPPKQAAFYRHLRRVGVCVYFLIHDLIPILHPHTFPKGTKGVFMRWLGEIAHSDGAVCVSRAVADDVLEWLTVFGPNRLRPFSIGWSHNGSDFTGPVRSEGLPPDARLLLDVLRLRPTFLMVGTIEPRKGHSQVFEAFDLLWRNGDDVNLVIVGKEGWMVEDLVEKLRGHPELDRRLFRLEGISDEYLDRIYEGSTCLIAASEAEGFGLPLVEAARQKLPVIASDIPVFREVGGNHVFYFKGAEPDSLADAIRRWLSLHRAGKAPASSAMPRVTWKQSTQNLLDVILGGKWYRTWMPDGIKRFWGADHRMITRVGKIRGREIVSTGKAGYLLRGPNASLAAGDYRVVVSGALGAGGAAKARFDVALDKGNTVLAKTALAKSAKDGCLASVSISLDAPCNGLETRVWVDEHSEVAVSKVEIQPFQKTRETGHETETGPKRS
ncbi:MAG TPA: glycosyltransferase family 1 protein [Syntrophobacteraceae bacterium]|nr:glycosyltransferase family 1 protein [Syntrophobacteraceae bacterium]